jgi:hypothetical protein
VIYQSVDRQPLDMDIHPTNGRNNRKETQAA